MPLLSHQSVAANQRFGETAVKNVVLELLLP